MSREELLTNKKDVFYASITKIHSFDSKLLRFYVGFIKTIFKDEKIDPDWTPSQRSYLSERVSSQESAQTEISMDIAPSWTGPALSPSPEVTSSNPRPGYSRGI